MGEPSLRRHCYSAEPAANKGTKRLTPCRPLRLLSAYSLLEEKEVDDVSLMCLSRWLLHTTHASLFTAQKAVRHLENLAEESGTGPEDIAFL